MGRQRGLSPISPRVSSLQPGCVVFEIVAVVTDGDRAKGRSQSDAGSLTSHNYQAFYRGFQMRRSKIVLQGCLASGSRAGSQSLSSASLPPFLVDVVAPVYRVPRYGPAIVRNPFCLP